MVKAHTNTSRHSTFALAAAGMGVVVGFLYLWFEWIVNNGSNWLWNDLVQSDTYRWRVIPLAIVMSVLFTTLLLALGKERVLKPSLGLLAELDEVKKTSVKAIGVIIVVGACSLIAGASLGPEASLVAATMAVAAWLSGKLQVLKQPVAFVFSIASIGALLAAFFNSLLPVLIPLLLLKQKGKLTKSSALLVVLAGLTAWAVVRVIKNEAYIELPVAEIRTVGSVSLAMLLGFISVALTVVAKWAIHIFFPVVRILNNRLPWVASAGIFGFVIGMLYFVGGQTVQFSGSEGLKLLSQNPAQYSAAALIGLVVVKLVATAWSTTTGYRGGLVFPSVYMGVALSVAYCTAFNVSGGTEVGAIIGAVTGIFMGMINPIVGLVLALTMFPFSLTIVVASAAVGALVALRLSAKLLPAEAV